MNPDGFYGIVLAKASHLTSCPLRKRNWASYPEGLRHRTPSKEMRRPTGSKCMGFDNVRKKGTFFMQKSQRQNASVTIRHGGFRLVQPFVFMLQLRIKIVSTNSLKE
jgi:hypothetical protein